MNTSVGGSQASAGFSASLVASSSAVNFLGIIGGGSASTKLSAQARYQSSFRSFSYYELKFTSGWYNRVNGNYLYQFQYLVTIDGTVVSTAKEDYFVQANNTPQCFPGKNLNLEYSQCTA